MNINVFKKPINLAALMMVSSLSLGELSFLNVRVTWITFGLFLMFLTKEMIGNISLFNLSKPRYKLVIFFCFFLFYGSFLFLMSGKHLEVVSFYESLLINIALMISLIFYCKGKEELNICLQGLIIGLLINIAIGVYNTYTGNHLTALDSSHLRYGTHFPLAYYGNPNDYASFIGIGILATFFYYAINRKYLIIMIILNIVGFHLIDRSGSRAIFISILLLYLLFALIYIFKNLIRKYWTYFAVVIAFMAIGFVYILLFDFSIFSDFILNHVTTQANASSDLFRLQLIQDAFTLVNQSHGFGLGPGMSTYYLGINLHNFYLEVLTEYGVFVFIGILYITIYNFIFNNDGGTFEFVLSKAYFPVLVILTISSSAIFRDRSFWVLLLLAYLIPHETKEITLAGEIHE